MNDPDWKYMKEKALFIWNEKLREGIEIEKYVLLHVPFEWAFNSNFIFSCQSGLLEFPF